MSTIVSMAVRYDPDFHEQVYDRIQLYFFCFAVIIVVHCQLLYDFLEYQRVSVLKYLILRATGLLA